MGAREDLEELFDQDQEQEKHNKSYIKLCALIVLIICIVSYNTNKYKTTSKDNIQISTRATSATETVEATALPGSAAEAVQKGALTMAEIQKRADAIGWSTDAWQEWYYVANRSGVAMESIEETALNINQQLAARDPEFLASLAVIGISEEDASAMKPEELFDKVITGLQNMEG